MVRKDFPASERRSVIMIIICNILYWTGRQTRTCAWHALGDALFCKTLLILTVRSII